MKKIFLCLCLLAAATCGFAQRLTSGTLKPLADEKKLNIEVDYTDALIDNLPVEDFAATRDNWELAQTELWGKFVATLNEKMIASNVSLLRCGHFEDAYTLVLRVEAIAHKGAMRATVDILDREGNVIATISNLKSDGGHIGSFYNLAGDGIRDAAERLVPVINRGRFAK
jgi:hypothetical protein